MYPHQSDRLTEALDRAKVDALVAASPANVAYVTGFRDPYGIVIPGAELGVFTRNGTALIAPAAAAPAIVAGAVDVDHVVAYGDLRLSTIDASATDARRLRDLALGGTRDMPDALASALDRLGVGQSSLGLDESWLSHGVFRLLCDRFHSASVVAGASALAGARRVKGPYEIECLWRGLQIAEEALDAVIQTLERGTTESEAATQWSVEVLKRGGWPFPPLVGIGVRSAIAAPSPTDAALRPGTVIRFDVGCAYKGYASSLARTAVLGDPPGRHEEAYQVVQACLEAAVTAVAGGAPAARVLEAFGDAARGNGELGAELAWQQVGYGIGLERREAPTLTNGEGALEAGEVLCIETSFDEPGSFGLSARDTVLVTTSGARSLNRSHHGFVVLE